MKEDDLSYALAQAVHLGVVVVASAGNSADRPYIVGSPSSQPEVLSVAQTAVPSAKTYPLVLTIAGVPTTINNTNTVDWAPLGTGFTGDVVKLGRGCPAPDVAVEDPYLGNPAGKVATDADARDEFAGAVPGVEGQRHLGEMRVQLAAQVGHQTLTGAG